MTKVGYMCVSGEKQNLGRQLKALEGVSKVFSDRTSGQSVECPRLQVMLDYIHEGDIVVVTELDRLGRNNKELTKLMNQIRVKGATLEVLNLSSINGIEDENLRWLINNLVIESYRYQAESERKRTKRRQAQGIEIAKKKGKFKGRQLKFKENDPRLQRAFDLSSSGLFDKEVEEQTGVNHRMFRRYRLRYNVTADQRENNEKRDS